VFALFVNYKRPGESAGVAVFWHVLQFAALALIIVGFGQVARHMSDAPALSLSSPESQEQVRAKAIESHVNAINAGQEAFRAAYNRRDAEAANRAIAQLDGVPPLDPQPDKFRLELKQLLVRAHDLALLSETERKGEKRVQGQLKQLGVDFKAWEQRSDSWVEAEGEKYGIHLEKEQAAPAAPPAATATPEKN
ncbi:MAG: hypothetical protein LC747_09225, partial [Acidobacteria bacterium]|nr:hypothetical protein [Acidobacteriota bacterium]